MEVLSLSCSLNVRTERSWSSEWSPESVWTVIWRARDESSWIVSWCVITERSLSVVWRAVDESSSSVSWCVCGKSSWNFSWKRRGTWKMSFKVWVNESEISCEAPTGYNLIRSRIIFTFLFFFLMHLCLMILNSKW